MKSIDLRAAPPATEQLDAERVPLRGRARLALTFFWTLTVGLCLAYGFLYEASTYPWFVLLAGAPVFACAFWVTHRYDLALMELQPWTGGIDEGARRYEQVASYLAKVQKLCRPLTVREACYLNEYANARRQQDRSREDIEESHVPTDD
jgi:hypothetical protein